MNYADYRHRLPRVLITQGIPVPGELRGLDAFWPAIERIRAEGGVFIIKVDGERTASDDNGPYTSIVSMGRLGRESFHTDAGTLEDALSYALVNYFEAKPK